MPNWCNNHLSIMGETTELKKVKKILSGEENPFLTFSSLCPIPPELKPEDHYEFKMTNWGTRDEPEEVSCVDVNETEVEYFFTTPWSPPDSFVRELVERFPQLDILLEYAEPGCSLWGLIGSEGEIEGELEDLDTAPTFVQDCFDSLTD